MQEKKENKQNKTKTLGISVQNPGPLEGKKTLFLADLTPILI